MKKMVKRKKSFFEKNISFCRFIILLIIVLSSAISFRVFAEGAGGGSGSGVDCGRYTGNYTGCKALNSSCFWGNNSGSVPEDPYCMIKSDNYDSTGQTMYAWWLNRSLPFFNITSGNLINSGCCIMKMTGSYQGCDRFNMNESGCRSSYQYIGSNCTWKPNNQNQNPSCSNSVGCCEKLGCWSFAGTQTASNNCTTAFNGLCALDTFCPMGDCCRPKTCTEASNQDQCEKLVSQLSMPCSWTGSACTMAGGGFSFYNDSSSCMTRGGWFNASGSCVMPSFTGGGGNMYAQEAKCWFADNKPGVCLNVTGCVYCSNAVTQLTNASSACYNAPSGSCKGHESLTSNWNGSNSIPVIDIIPTSMNCSNIRLKQICNCGPLPNCVWNNGSANTGNYCEAGMKTSDIMATCAPPVMFCEDTKAKNNQTLCDLLARDYMMPCKWSSTSNCSFNNIAVFGGGGGSGSSIEYTLISNEISCIAAGGTWRSEYYVDTDGSMKSDSWCEKGALFNFATGMASANKGNCDSDCWACEFNSTGGSWGSNVSAQRNCTASKKGVCQFKFDRNAPNGYGWCNYPKEFEMGGMKDCSTDCKTCEFMQTPQEAISACYGSSLGCSWVNDTGAMNGKGGYCIGSSKKSCISDCFSCYSQSECSNSSFHPTMNCSWDPNFRMCKPSGFTGEICFNAMDDDNDGKIDCADSDCTYDQFCGGARVGSGGVDCKKIFIQSSCTKNRTASGTNCTWVTPSFGGQSYCDFPGSDCWMYETNITTCTNGRGCIYRNATAGYPSLNFIPSLVFKNFTGFCDMNKTKSETCFSPARMNNYTACNASSECIWVSDNYSFSGGRCEFKPFYYCGLQNLSTCSGMCSWMNNSFSSSGGFCQPSCSGKSQGACTGFCSWKSTSCEPEAFGGMESGGMGTGGFGGGFGCHAFDGNRTNCISNNMTCAWMAFSQNASNANAGVCEPKGQQQMMAGMDMSPPKPLGSDSNDTSIGEIDIREYGVKDSSTSLGYGIIVTNITNAAVCRGYYIGGGMSGPKLGSGNSTTKFYWYLDTNKNANDGCNATNQLGANLTGFEFLIKYVVSLDNLTVSETKSFFKCASGNWVLTNVALTSNRQYVCGMNMPGFGNNPGKMGGAMILVDKENLESFAEYNKTAPMRVFVSSANDSTSELNPIDSANIGYYTLGSADFKFVDCNNPLTKDAKCMNFQKFGFNVFEDCKNGKDDDSDGNVDCADMKCKFAPNCASGRAFNFSADANDTQSPTVSFSQVDVLRDSAFVKFDTDEPANGTLGFYGNDSSCLTINLSLNDLGDSLITFDDYKPFHVVSLDISNLGYLLNNGTIYYYKTSVCDPSGNCASSACLNFTTSNEAYKNFVFKLKLPPGYNVTIPALNYSGNFTTKVTNSDGTNITYETGIKTNASVSRNMNITINCGNQSLTFMGADILKPKSIDMSTAFICEGNSTNGILGMNSTSKSWNQLIGDIGMGGQSDYIKLTYPITYNSSNNITWCNDELTNCTNVNEYANCSTGGTGKTDCKIPTSLGFSAYSITAAATTIVSNPSSDPSTNPNSGGTPPVVSKWVKEIKLNQSELNLGQTLKALKVNYRMTFNVSGVGHSVGILNISSTSVMIEVASTPVNATLSVGETKKFDVNADNYYDVSVTLLGITSGAADLLVKTINEKMPTTPSGTGSNATGSAGTGETGDSGQDNTESGKGWDLDKIKLGIYILIAIVVLIIVIYLIFKYTRQKRLFLGY